jgi:hypothetical protein
MLFPQLLCFENDPSFMGGCPLNKEIMNSTITNSSSTVSPLQTSRMRFILASLPIIAGGNYGRKVFKIAQTPAPVAISMAPGQELDD